MIRRALIMASAMYGRLVPKYYLANVTVKLMGFVHRGMIYLFGPQRTYFGTNLFSVACLGSCHYSHLTNADDIKVIGKLNGHAS